MKIQRVFEAMRGTVIIYIIIKYDTTKHGLEI